MAILLVCWLGCDMPIPAHCREVLGV